MNKKSARSGEQKKNNTKNTDNFSKDEVKDLSIKKYKSHSKQSREKPENVSVQSKRKSGRSKNESEAFFKETSLSNPKRHVENENKIKKHRSRSSENFNQNSKVKPGHLRREKTIHVEKIRKYPHHKHDTHSMKSLKEKKFEEKEVRKHKHRSRSEKKSNQNEVVHHTEQLLFCQVENANPFKKTTTKEAIRSFPPLKGCKEKLHKVNDSNVMKENVHKRAKIDEHIFSPEVLYAHVHHKKNRPKLVVGRKPFKYSVLEPNSSSDHRKHRKLYKMSVNSLKNVQTKKNKRKLVENYSEDISPSTKPQFQEKIEDDLKSYFTRIQSLIDKKIDTLLQNYKSKIKLKGAIEEEIAEHGANMDYNKDSSRHHHHEPRKKSSHRTSNKDKGEAKKKYSMSRRERSFQDPADRNYDSVTAPSRHSSPPERKCKTPPRCNSPVVIKHDGMLQGPSLKRKNHDTFANYSVPVFTHHEHPRQCSPTSKNEEMAQYSNSREKRNVESPRHHNSPVDRRHESLQRHSTSSGRHYEALPCYSPVKTDCGTSQFPSQSNKFPSKSWKRFHQQNSSVEENLRDSPCYTSRQVNKVENNKMTSTKQLSNSIGNECIKRNLVDRYVDHREFKDSCTTPSKENVNLRKIKPHKENSFRVEGIEPAKLLECGNKPSKQRFKRNLECKTVSIIGIPSQLRKKYFRNPDIIEESVERKKRTKRFKLYYQYSRDNNYYYAESGNSSEGKSVVSDSLRVISDDSECHIEMCKIKKQHGSTDNSECYKKHQKTSVPSNIFSKHSTDRNIIYRDPGKQRHKTSADSKLNNIIEEKTSLSSSGEHKKLNLEIDCKYFRVLQSSSSDYGVGSKNKYGLPFQNDKKNVSEKIDNKVAIKYRDNITNVNKPKRRRDLTNDTLRKTRNSTQKPKEQKQKIISKSDVDISYKSLVGLMKSSNESSEVEKNSSQESSRTPETVVDRKSRTFTGKIDDVKSFIDLGYPKKDDISIDVKEYVQKLQQIYFGFETLRPQKYFINNEIGIQKCLIDNLTGYSEISKKSNDKTNIDEDHTNSLLRKIYNLIENQNREKSEIAKVFKIDMKEEKEVQVVSCKQDEEISTKDLPSYHEKFEGYTSAEKTNEVKLNKLVMKDIVTQETYARDIGTEVDKNSIKDREAYVSTNILGNKKDANDIGINVHDSDTKKDAKCISTTNILKTDMAVEVNTTEEHVEGVPANFNLKHKDISLEDEMNLQRNFKKRNSFGQLPKHKYVAASKIQKIDMAIEVDTTKKYSKDVPEEHLLKIIDPVVEDKTRLPIVYKDGSSPNNLSESKCVSTSLIQKVDLALEVNTAENLFRDILEQDQLSEDEIMISRHSTEKSLLSQIPKPKRISIDRVQKIDMAVEVNTTEDHIKDALEDDKLKMKNISREDRMSQLKVSKEKSSINQLFKPKCVSTVKIPKADMAVEVNTTEEHMRNILPADRLKINASLDSKMKQLNVSDETSSLNQLSNPKWGSTAKIQKVDMAVGVNTAETHKLITKDTAVETKINSFRISKEKSSLNQLHKPINEYKPQFVSYKKRKDKHEMIQEQLVVDKDDRKEHIQLKSSSVRTKTLKNMKEEHDLYGSCDSKSIKSKMPITKKHMVLDASADNKPRKKEKSELNGCKASSKLKKSKSEISFRKTHIDAEESKITSLVCLHKYCNIIKYETSSKSNTHSLDHYPSSEHRESSRLFLTKDYRTSDISAYKKRKIYDEAIRRKMRRKAGIQSKTNLAPQVFEVRFVTIDNFHGNFLKNAKTVEKGDFYETNYENTLTRTGYRSKIPECYFEGNFKRNINFTPIKTPMHQLKLWEFYQKALKCPNSYSSCEDNNIIMKAGEALQRNYECLTGKNRFLFIDCLCKYLLSENVSNNMNIDENRLDRPISYSLEEYNTSSCTDSKEESIADSIASYENEHEKDLINRDNVDDIECVIDRKLGITGNLSCPILRERDSSFDYLYQIESDDKLNNIGTFLNPKKPVNAILGYALNGNTSQTSLKPLMASSSLEVDFEAPCSEESGYSSTRSRHSFLSITNFFKKPNIAALMKPQSRNWFHSDENLHSEKSTSRTQIFTDYQKMKKQCQEYAQKVTEFSKSKICMDADYEEIPLEVLIGKQIGVNVIRFRSESILEKKIEYKKKEYAESEPTDYVTQNKSNINLLQKFDCSLQSKDHTQNNHVSVIYENMADNDSCQLKDDDTEEEPHRENDRNLDTTESLSVESLELSEIDSKSDIELLTKILNSEVFLSSTNFSTYCITIMESQNLKSEIHGKSSSSNDVLNDFSALKDEFNEGRKISSNGDILDDKSKKFENSVSKKFFENLLEVYEKEITICSALLEDKNFLENQLLHFAIDKLEKATELSKKSIVKNKIKMFIRNVFHTKNKRKSQPNVFSKTIEEDKSTLPPVDVVYQEKLQSLARSAYKYFSMFVQAVEHNHKINDEMKICGLMKLLERIEKGHFKFLRRKESVDFEKEIKDQVKQAFSEIYCKASKEAEINHRKLSANDIHMIATFVCKYRIGLLSRTDLIASYIGQGFFRTEQQLKGKRFAHIYVKEKFLHDGFIEYWNLKQFSTQNVFSE